MMYQNAPTKYDQKSGPPLMKIVQKPTRESASRVSKRLASYSAAATLGALALGEQAQAAIVYTDVPDISITQGGTPIYINLDNAGYNEFAISAFLDSVRVNPYNIAAQDSKVLTSGTYYVFAFESGAIIDGTAEAAGGGRFAGRYAGYNFYNFVGTGGYIGVKWDIGGGDVRYGWLRVDVSSDNNGTATLFSYAYEDLPNTPIVAGAVPEPGSLGLLAAGLGSLALRRRRDK